MPILSILISNPYIQVGGVFTAFFLTFTTQFFPKCTEKSRQMKNEDIRAVETSTASVTPHQDPVRIFYMLTEIENRYSKINKYIDYSFFGGIGIIFSSIVGGVAPILNFEEYVGLIAIVLAGAFFSTNLLPLIWWYYKH